MAVVARSAAIVVPIQWLLLYTFIIWYVAATTSWKCFLWG